MSLLTQPVLDSVLEAAVQAPSADNHHAFRLSFDNDRLILQGTAEYESAPFHRKVLHLLSFGAVAENILIRAAAMQLQARVVSLPEGRDSPVVAELCFGRTETPSQVDLSEAIPLRHTNRRMFYRGPPLAAPERAQLQAQVSVIDSVQLVWLDERAVRRHVARLVADAEAARFSERPLHRELFSAIRFDIPWDESEEEGIPPGALGIEAPLRPLFATLRHWSVMRILAGLGAHRLAAARAAYWPCRLSPHLCALSTALSLEHGAFATGRALQRAWLFAAAMGLALQPLAASTLYALDGYRDVPAELRRRLQAGWHEVGGEGRALMVFRLGRADPPRVRSGRPSSFTRFMVGRA